MYAGRRKDVRYPRSRCVDQDLRRHQRGGRAARRRPRCRRARLRVRAGQPPPGDARRPSPRSCIGCPGGVITVGVFRDETKERVVELVNTLGLERRAAPRTRAAVRRPVDPPARAVRDPGLRRRRSGARRGRQRTGRHRAGRRRRARVRGTAFDWALADAVPPGVRLLLAGGLNGENVAQAIRRVRPWGVDVATGVETTPGSGRKDARKLRRFIDEARVAGRRSSAATAGRPTPTPLPTTGWPTARDRDRVTRSMTR